MPHPDQPAIDVAEEPQGGGHRLLGAIVGGALVLGILALLVIGFLNRDIGTSIQDALDEGKRPAAPDITLPVLSASDEIGPEGAEVSTADMRGRIIVLNFWASWCEPCRDEAPVLEDVARRYRDSGDVTVIGVNVQDLREKALSFVKQNAVTYPTLREGGDSAQRKYQIRALPETFVVDREGRIALKIPGQVTAPEQLTTAIGQLATAQP